MLEFLKAYRKWVFEGVPKHQIFTKDYGLCRHAVEWGKRNIEDRKLYEVLHYQLKKDFPDTWRFPFGGQDFYYLEADAGKCHLNAKRVAWVEKIIGELEMKP